MSVKLANNFVEVLKTFNDSQVDYIIVGVYAVIFHGYVRTTGDLDIWVRPVEESRNSLLEAFENLELSEELNEYVSELNFTEPFSVKLGDEPLQVDVFNAIMGVEYSEAEKNSIDHKLSDDLKVRFIKLDDLITNKMLTGRLKDKADVEELQRIGRQDSNS